MPLLPHVPTAALVPGDGKSSEGRKEKRSDSSRVLIISKRRRGMPMMAVPVIAEQGVRRIGRLYRQPRQLRKTHERNVAVIHPAPTTHLAPLTVKAPRPPMAPLLLPPPVATAVAAAVAVVTRAGGPGRATKNTVRMKVHPRRQNNFDGSGSNALLRLWIRRLLLPPPTRPLRPLPCCDGAPLTPLARSATPLRLQLRLHQPCRHCHGALLEMLC